jgi:hypothetical protein
LDVAFDGFLGDFEFFGEAEGVGKALGSDGLVDAEETFGSVATEVVNGGELMVDGF